MPIDKMTSDFYLLPFLNMRSNIYLIGKTTLRLRVQAPVCFRNFVWVNFRLCWQVLTVVLPSRNINRPVNVGPRYMDALRPELLRKRGGKSAFSKVGARKSSHVSIRFDPGRGASENQCWRMFSRRVARMLEQVAKSVLCE